MTYLQLGKLETEDQIDVARYLAKQRYIDSSRIGILVKAMVRILQAFAF